MSPQSCGNEKVDQAAKEALDEDISTTERYPPDDLKKWLTEEDFKKRDQRWKNGNNEMKERKPDVDRKEDTKGMPRKRASGNIQTQNRVYEGHPRPQYGRDKQSTMPLLQHLSIRRPHTVGMQRN
jgi:hypothetical protein